MNALLRNKRKGIIAALVALAALFSATAYAATSYTVPGGGGSAQINEWSTCKGVTNNSAQSLFVPTNSSAEWNAFLGKSPTSVSQSPCYTYSWQTGGWGSCSASCGGGTQTRSVYCLRSDGTTVANSYCTGAAPAGSQSCNTQSCCSANYGNVCYSSSNSCGQTNQGTYDCNGNCTASTPSNPWYYGQSCTLTSGSNSCGQTQTCGGTLNCSDSCTGTCNPPANPSYYGQTCTRANNCGATNTGTLDCNNNCSVSAPADCPYTTYTNFCPSIGGSFIGTNYGCNGTACYPTGYSAVCHPGEYYCSNNTRYQETGCQQSGSTAWCGSNQLEQSCSNNPTMCISGTLYFAPWTCGTSPSQCNYAGTDSCNGSFCGSDGNVWTENGCSGTSCTSAISQTCSYGCSNAACNPPPPPPPPPAAVCGNNIVESGELCDGNTQFLGSGSCGSVGPAAQDCNPDCQSWGPTYCYYQ